MSREEYRFEYLHHEDHQQLSEPDQALVQAAAKACSTAYAPYSQFKVGVAIRTDDGRVTIGSNQENEAFPIGQCAERVALYAMVHQYGRRPVDTIAIAVDHEAQTTPASPCGSCRQMLHEYRRHQERPLRLLLATVRDEGVIEIQDISDLLPLAFNGSFLGQ